MLVINPLQTHPSIKVAGGSPEHCDRVLIFIATVTNSVGLALALGLVLTTGGQLGAIDRLDQVLVSLGVEISKASLALNLGHDHESTEVLSPVAGLQSH